MQPWVKGILMISFGMTFLAAAIFKFLNADDNYHKRMATKNDKDKEMYWKAAQSDFVFGFSCIYISVIFFVIAFFQFCRVDYLRRNILGYDSGEESSSEGSSGEQQLPEDGP
jgi:hypothetical protein